MPRVFADPGYLLCSATYISVSGMAKIIETTKSELRAALRAEFVAPLDHSDTDPNLTTEIGEVIDELVKQADNHRGTYSCYDHYLDAEIVAHPDNSHSGE